MAIMMSVQVFARHITKQGEEEHVEKRRALLKDKNLQDYQKVVQERMIAAQGKVGGATKQVL